MGKPLFKQFKLNRGEQGCEFQICDGYTEKPTTRVFLYDSELIGLYNTLKRYLEDKELINDSEDYVYDACAFAEKRLDYLAQNYGK